MPPTLESIALKVKTLGKRNPAYAEIVQWMGDLLSEVVQASAAGGFQPPQLDLEPESRLEAWSRGKAFLKPEELPLDWEQIGVLYRRLVKLIAKREDGRRQAEGLGRALEQKDNGTPTLLKAVLASDLAAVETAARDLAVDPPVLTLLLRLSLRPALTTIAQSVRPRLNLDRWQYGHCPVCGSAPKLADLSGEGGKRRLHCSLCESEWFYPRLRCPFCENENREELSYLRAETEDGLRVDLCARCRHYIKTIDLRHFADPIIMPLDDVATWHLDIIAGQKFEDQGQPRSRGA